MILVFSLYYCVNGLHLSSSCHEKWCGQRKRTVLSATRRDMMNGVILGSTILGSLPTYALNPMIDSGKKRSSYDYDAPPAYLAEPTEEFKKAEAERAAFRKKQAEYKKVWDTAFANFQAATADDTKLIATLSNLSQLVARNGGLPSGLKLTDMITLCRRVKAKATDQGNWNTQVEMEYMTLVRTVKRAQNPNLSTEDSGYL
eukprot:CAMPEP_0197313576 /NCGR_PEP_ID=MMETSP0891-20130614/28340_1 /TAXON_ID=44058 ORGANISM="Aureoumbra lagunensis, Strain CCMP1510" /NCGR_SAMPLE_ID=MMETSP0891 /ASSEMBLY_ACC=CAM_ASM_000534 /LENGTH=200 /DNA_ID=CAMNT_0042801511 /DNA_START=14 /DNA_END=616 /DNA_ORIENTATION=-